MESKKGLFSHFGVLIRIVILIVLFAVIAFFLVRFVQNRRNTDKAKQAVQTSKSQNNAEESSEEGKSDSDSGSSNQPSSSSAPVPSGVADSNIDVPSAGPSVVPSTGAGLDSVYTITALILISFLVAKNRQQRRIFAELS